MEKFVVETKTFFKEDVKDELMELTTGSFKIFKKQESLISIQMHLNHSGNQTMSLLELESKEYHEACIQSPDFEEWNHAWQRLIEEEKISRELNTYKILHEFRTS